MRYIVSEGTVTMIIQDDSKKGTWLIYCATVGKRKRQTSSCILGEIGLLD